jgi:Cu(I)/Ag(I) efflux system membrane fusion protein
MTVSHSSTPSRQVLAALGPAALVAAALLAAWYFTRGGPAPAGQPQGHQHGGALASDSVRPVLLSERDQQRIGVTFAPVEMVPLERTVRIVAQVTYDETRVVTVAPRFEGYVERLYADFTGQQVQSGEVLLELYSPMVAATAEEMRVAMRLAEDVASGTAESRESAARLVRAARQRLLAWNVPASQIAQVEEHGATLRTVMVHAPASGVVLQKNVLPGQRVMEGETLYTIADLGVVWIEGEVFEQDLAAAQVGQAVEVEFQALPGVVRTGRITYVYPTLSLETRTGRVRIALSNPGLQLKPGMFATLKFPAAVSGPVLTIPRSAVLSTGERNLVFVRSADGRFTPVDIVVGVQTEDRVEVRRGLSAGDMVIASATFLVDAESNLGSLFGGMGDMPGMDLTAPAGPQPGGGDGERPAPAPAMPMPSRPDSAHQHGGI